MTTTALLAALAAVAAGCGPAGGRHPGTVAVVAGENQYGNVAAQVGGRYVQVYSVVSNPNVDPHSYEATPSVAGRVAAAGLLVENGLGYDSFMEKLAAASPNRARKVLDVQHLLHLPDSTANPHLWYEPGTMPAVAGALADDLAALDPAHAAAFRANAGRFVASLAPWTAAIGSFRAAHGGTPAATTEPVADDLLAAMGIDIATPFSFQADVMNGTDPSPQAVAQEEGLLTGHRVKLLCFNAQVTDPLTSSIRQTARRAGVPVVAVYETMPTGYSYQSWMVAEEAAVARAVVAGSSTERL